ncbi:MAG: SRPBCC family protein [Elusimicrobiota bacterium]|jgi:hypothetical protein
MPSAKEQFTVLAPPPAVWRRITDFSRWGPWMVIEDPAAAGMGGQFARIDGEGSTARVGMFNGQELVQVFETTDYLPPERLKLRLKEWNVDAADRAITSFRKETHPGRHRWYAAWLSEQWDFSIQVAPGDVTKATTTVTLECSIEFTHPLGFLLLPGAESWIVRMLRRFSQGFVASVEKEGPDA